MIVGEAAGGQLTSSKDVVLYDGAKSHISQYSFCYLCKERLDTYHDEVDENWYFLDTKQVRFKQSSKNTNTNASNKAETGVFNVHTSCLKEIEEINHVEHDQNQNQQNQAAPMLLQKRTYVDASNHQ